MNNWLLIAVAAFLIGMTLYGHHKGFLRLVVSMAAMIITLVVVNITLPHVTDYVKNHTPLYDSIGSGIMENLQEYLEGAGQMPAEERSMIENLPIPETLKKSLLENNNGEIYQALGVDTFADYIRDYLTNMIVNAMCFVLTFLAVYILLTILVHAMNIITKLPIIHGINKMAGAVLGMLEGLVFVWLLCLVLTAFSGREWAAPIFTQIENSRFLSFLYGHNLFTSLVMGLIGGLM